MSRRYVRDATKTVSFKLWSDTNQQGFVEYLHMREYEYDDDTGVIGVVEVYDPPEDVYTIAAEYGATIHGGI